MIFDYYDVKRKDVINIVRDLIDSRVIEMQYDGRFKFNTWISPDDPWIHMHKKGGWRKCGIFREVIAQRMNIIPHKCMDCWKVVVRPRNLREHMQLYDIQKELGRRCKLGMETRSYVHGLWGGYFYNDSLEQGLGCWQAVRYLVNEKIAPGVSVILKRACTEFEMKFGPSDTWAVTEKQAAAQDIIESMFIHDDTDDICDHVQCSILRRWVEWAFAHGDHTYKEFLGDGEDLSIKYVTYHPAEI